MEHEIVDALMYHAKAIDRLVAQNQAMLAMLMDRDDRDEDDSTYLDGSPIDA